MPKIEIINRADERFEVLFDEIDAELVGRHTWSAMKIRRGSGLVYARTTISGKTVLMHSLILGTRPGLVIDHLDGNGLNNTRINIEHVTQTTNMRRAQMTTLHQKLLTRPAYAYDFWKAKKRTKLQNE